MNICAPRKNSYSELTNLFFWSIYWQLIVYFAMPLWVVEFQGQLKEFQRRSKAFKKNLLKTMFWLLMYENIFYIMCIFLFSLKNSWQLTINVIYFQLIQVFFKKKKLGFTPCKAKQPLRGMELQESKHKKKITGYRKSV